MHPMSLFGKLRTQILSLLFLNEGKEYYIREIASIAGVSPRGAQNELVKLEREGILKSELRGKQRFFSVNERNPAYREMKSLILKNFGVPVLLVEAIAGIENIKEAFIYGSFAKGEQDFTSDIDFFVITSGKIDYERLSSRISGLEEQLGREISIDIMAEKEYKKRLAADDPYVADVDSGERIFVVGGAGQA